MNYNKGEELALHDLHLNLVALEAMGDPAEELDYFSLAIGFFLARNINADRAYELAVHARYDLNIA